MLRSLCRAQYFGVWPLLLATTGCSGIFVRPTPQPDPSTGKLECRGAGAPVRVAPAPGTAGDWVTIHYYRPDGEYRRWGLHAWESFQRKEEAGDEWAHKVSTDRPVLGISWFKPLPPRDKDDFGVYWLLPIKEFEKVA